MGYSLQERISIHTLIHKIVTIKMDWAVALTAAVKQWSLAAQAETDHLGTLMRE